MYQLKETDSQFKLQIKKPPITCCVIRKQLKQSDRKVENKRWAKAKQQTKAKQR